jgi:hypothetical protein
MTTIEWLRERYENTQRLAALKDLDDRAGWLEDGRFFADAIERMQYLEDLAQDHHIFVPGLWECSDCRLVISHRSIFADTGEPGTTAKDGDNSEPCPNARCKNRPLARITWEEYSKQLASTGKMTQEENYIFRTALAAICNLSRNRHTQEAIHIAQEAIKHCDRKG